MSKMIINDRRNSKVIRELSEGDIFSFDNEYYIYADDVDAYIGINLQSGKRRFFRDDDKITSIRATLIIE